MKPTVVEVRPVASLGWQLLVGKQEPRKSYCFFRSVEDANEEAETVYRMTVAFWNLAKVGPAPVLMLANISGCAT